MVVAKAPTTDIRRPAGRDLFITCVTTATNCIWSRATPASFFAVVLSGQAKYTITPWKTDAGLPAPSYRLHTELGSGLSFENSPGGVRVDFIMADCPSAKAGVRIGDLVVSIDGEPTRNALDAFARVRKPSDEASSLELLVRRDGQDLKLTVR